jgi:negative regulator of flagellin synthesis FlgM
MISKVKDASAQMLQQYQKGESVKSEAEKPVGAGGSLATEKVDLSAKAQEIQRVKRILDEVPEIREEKVQALKSQIANGTYPVDPDRIAEKMVGEALIDIIA